MFRSPVAVVTVTSASVSPLPSPAACADGAVQVRLFREFTVTAVQSPAPNVTLAMSLARPRPKLLPNTSTRSPPGAATMEGCKADTTTLSDTAIPAPS